MTSLLLVTAAVLITSAGCSLFEAVLYTVPRTHIEALSRRGRRTGRILMGLRQQVDRPIAAILSLNTIANTGGGALAGALAASVLGESNVLYFSAVFTLAILVFSEVVPKTFGVVHARRLAAWIAFPLQALTLAFRPLTALTAMFTRLILHRHPETVISDEEVLTLVRSGLRSGDFELYEAQIIANVLKLEKKTATDVLTPRTVVFALNADATAKEALALTGLTYSRVPVFDRDPDDVVGIVHRVDILTAVAEDRFDVKIESLMRPIQFVVESMTLDKLLQSFLERRGHMVAVIDEFGGFAGIVTLEDVLEELLGREIVDESDRVADMRLLAHERRRESMRHRSE